MRLASLVPSISAEAVAHLESCAIRTDADLLFTPTFDIFRRLPPGTLSLQDLTRLCSTVAKLTSAEPVLASDLLEAEERAAEHDSDLSTGDSGLDALLHGLGGRRIIEISGERGSGKTALALNIILHHLVHHLNATVAWVDASGDFSPARASHILNSSGTKDVELVLERLQVSYAFDVDSLHAVLDQIYSSNSIPPKFLVIDPITPLLGPILSAVSSHGHAVMTDLMRRLRTCAKTFGTTILVVNNSTLKYPFDGSTTVERKPALGPSFAFMTDTTLWLSQQSQESPDEPPLFLLEILKSRSKPSGASCSFILREGTIITL